MAAFAAVYAALLAAHHVGDFWVQTQHQADTKGLPGWVGRWNCAKHVATYTVTGLLALLALAAATGWRPQVWPLLAGLAVSAVTHYVADRREPLRRLAVALGSAQFWNLGVPKGPGDKPCLGTGAYALDQSWHIGWLFVAALVIA
jgi:hypothetical protein